MRIAYRFMISLSLIFTLLTQIEAQDRRGANPQGVPETITAFASTDRVRFTGAASIVQMNLEVYTQAGVKLFDLELKGGNVLDWPLENGRAERFSPGSYLCVLTVKNLSGRISQKI